jgi:hypothetical protein
MEYEVVILNHTNLIDFEYGQYVIIRTFQNAEKYINRQSWDMKIRNNNLTETSLFASIVNVSKESDATCVFYFCFIYFVIIIYVETLHKYPNYRYN